MNHARILPKVLYTECTSPERRHFLAVIGKATVVVAGMSLLSPSRAQAAVTGYDPATIVKEHPTCKHFWPCDNLVSGKIVDYVGGAHLHPTAGAFSYTPGNMYIDPTLNGDTQAIIVDAPFATVGTHVFFTMVVMAQRGKMGGGIQSDPHNASQVGIFELWHDGVTSSSHIGNNRSALVQDDLNLTPSSTPVAVGIVFKPGRVARFFSINTAGTLMEVKKDNDPAMTELTNILPFYQGLESFGNKFNGISKLYGMMQCQFSEIPYDWEAAAKWMFTEWVAGNKQIYPGWRAA